MIRTILLLAGMIGFVALLTWALPVAATREDPAIRANGFGQARCVIVLPGEKCDPKTGLRH